MAAPAVVNELVERFASHRDEYRSGRYNETQLRRDFLDPLFAALGWDVHNEQGYAEAYREVIHEAAIKIGGRTKAPDYCFRAGGGVRSFFVEAKKPSIDIRDAISPAYQLRRYAWSAKLPVSILSDFEEFAVYDCRVRPNQTDKASTARVLYLKYIEYIERWDELQGLFSPEAIRRGDLDKFISSKKAKKGTAEVDKAFLDEIESWRDVLARNVALRNKGISPRDLNFAVQRTIDRTVFLRICEDRGIEPYGTLLGVTNGPKLYARLGELFRRADDRYNSGLFYFTPEKGRADPPDELTLGLAIDDNPLKAVIKNLYYPDSPYEFSVLPAEILGQVYEQFLGKVIRLTRGGQAKVEEKPEVRKAGGVYYTPKYIVDYIVEHTVGKLLEGKTPHEVGGLTKTTWKTSKRGRPLTVLDPACGSGSFLIGAYQHLLDWHRDQYIAADPEQHARGSPPRLYRGPAGDWRLTTAEKKRILLSNIYGVDIDPQAVEVTKLSLLLKVLEGESQQTLSNQLRLFHERALPDLSSNIKCGNSLIGPDFYDDRQMSLLDEEEKYRINVFDWKAEFPEMFKGKNPGFDAVIGNPPYVDIKTLPDRDVRYVFDHYTTANNRVNLFAAFIEKCLSLVKNTSFRFSMIVPTALLAQSSYCALRRLVLDEFDLASLVRLPNESFGSAAGEVKVDTVIVVIANTSFKKLGTEIIAYAGYERISKIDPSAATAHAMVQQTRWLAATDCVWSINTSDADEAILQKCTTSSVPLDDCVDFCLGLTPYDKYKGHSPEQIKKRVFHATEQKDDTFKPLLAGNDVQRYRIKWNRTEWISYGPWLGAPREQRFFTEKRILVKQIIDWTKKRIWASLTDEELYNTQNAFNLLRKGEYSLEYVLGLLNSRLMTYYHRKKYLDEFKMRFQKILIKDCRQLPIRIIDFSNPGDRARHDRMVGLVEGMLALRTELDSTRAAHQKTVIQRQIAATDRQIDRLVYELYNLTDEEIAIVEEATE